MTPNVAVRPAAVATRRSVRLSRRHLGRSVVIYVTFAAFAAWVLLPLWFTAMSSISQPAEMVARPPHWIPQSPTLENYEAVFGTASKARNSSEQNARIVTSLGWSLIIGVTVAALNLLIGGLAAYGYSRFRFRGSRSGYVFLLVSRVVPAIAIITPFFIAFRVTGLINTPFALIFS
jgi:ABC-type glycerol-3-phosphate transport system permease component